MPAYELVIDPNGANETRYASDGTQDGPLLGDSPLTFSRNPNAVSNWKATVPYDLSLENRISDEIWIQGDNVGFLFRGYLLTTDSSEQIEGSGEHQRTTKLSGYGVEYDLTRDETTRTFTNTFVADAIQTVWNNDTDFTATVTAPTAQNTVTNQQIQEADTDAEFNAITSNIADTTPFVVRNSNVESAQTAHFIEAEAASDDSGVSGYSVTTASLGNPLVGIDEWSEGSGIQLDTTGDEARWRVTDVTLSAGQDLDGLDYTIPEAHVGLAVRHSRSGDQTDVVGVDWYINNNKVGAKADGTGLALSWTAMSDSAYGSAGWADPPDRQSGFGDLDTSEVDIRVEVTEDTGATDYEFDAICLFDKRYHDHSNFDNSVDVNQGNLDSPELYPEEQLAFDLATDEWTITSATLTTTWNNTSGNQRIQLRHANGTYGPSDGTENNTTSITHDMGSEEGSTVQGRARFDSFPIGTSANSSTPKFNYNGQNLESWTLTYDGDDRPVINQDTIEGSVFQVLQELHRRGRMDFWVDHASDSKNANSAEAGDVTDTLGDVTVKDRTRTVDLRDYANHVTVRGKTVSGSRLTKTTSADAEINTYGKEHADVFTTLGSQEEVNVRARSELSDLLGERETTGEVTIVAKNLPPGPEYTDVPIDANNTISAQLVESDYAVRRGDLTSRLKFQLDPVDYGRNVAGLGTDIGDTKRGF